MKRLLALALLSILVLAVPGSAWAGMIYGPSARTQFENLLAADPGATFEDFETYHGDLMTTQVTGVTLATTQQRFPSVQNVNLPVAVLPYGFVTSNAGRLQPLRIGNIPDGQSQWAIMFDTPQRWAGLLRHWDTYALTSFYAGATLLGTHQNTANVEFVGYFADSSDTNTWVTKIVVDGMNVGGYHVGLGDDLFFGTVPEPSTVLLLGAGLAGLAACGRRRQA